MRGTTGVVGQMIVAVCTCISAPIPIQVTLALRKRTKVKESKVKVQFKEGHKPILEISNSVDD